MSDKGYSVPLRREWVRVNAIYLGETPRYYWDSPRQVIDWRLEPHIERALADLRVPYWTFETVQKKFFLRVRDMAGLRAMMARIWGLTTVIAVGWENEGDMGRSLRGRLPFLVTQFNDARMTGFNINPRYEDDAVLLKMSVDYDVEIRHSKISHDGPFAPAPDLPQDTLDELIRT